MERIMLVSAAALVLMTGGVFAQSMHTDTTMPSQSNQQVAPAGPGVLESSESRTIHSDGTETDKSGTYVTGNGTRATSNTLTIAPDGSTVTVSHDERITSPDGNSTTTGTTTSRTGR
jgi:hypothetical protein